MGVSGLKLNANLVEISECGIAYNCIRKPVDCTSLKSCDAVAAFQFDEEKNNSIVIQMATKHRWMAFAQTEKLQQYKMMKLRGEYCMRQAGSSITFNNFHANNLQENSKPSWIDKVDDIIINQTSVEDGVLVCRYERSVKPSVKNENIMYNMNEMLYGVIAYGSSGSDDSKPGYHDFGKYLWTQEKVNFLAVNKVEAGRASLNSKFKVHGILMIIAYILMASGGIFTSRYLKGVTQDWCLIKGKAAWFVTHVIFMSLCLLLMLMAFIIILVEVKGWSSEAGKHHFAGLFAVIAFLIQPVMASLRPTPDHPRRIVFNWAHRLVGMCGWILGCLSVIFAFDMLGKEYRLVIAFLVVTVVVGVILDVTLLCTSQDNQQPPQSQLGASGSEQEEGGEGKKEELSVEVSPPTKSAKRKYMVMLFCLVAFLFAFVVAVYLCVEVASW